MPFGVDVDINANFAKFSGQIDKIGKDLNKFSKKVNPASAALGEFKSLLTGLGVGSIAVEILNVNREMEGLRAQLQSVTGSAVGADVAFQNISDFAKNTPFQIQDLTEQFVRLKSFGIEPTNTVMEAITNQASKLGASTQTLSGITNALGQAWAKGKLQGEEILQLVERGVPVWDLLAQATGRSTAELNEMSSKGQLTRDAIQSLIEKMGELAAGSNARAMNTLNGKISNLADTWTRFQDRLLNSERENVIKKMVENWAGWIDYFDGLVNGMSDSFTGEISAVNDAIAEQKDVIRDIQNSSGIGNALFGDNINAEKGKLDALLQKRARLLSEYKDERDRQDAELEKKSADAKNAELQKSAKDSQLKEENRLNAEAQRLFDSTRTSLERLNERKVQYNKLLDAGKISQETFNRALKQANDEYQQSIGNVDGQNETLEQIQERIKAKQAELDAQNPFLQAKLRGTDDPRYNRALDKFNTDPLPPIQPPKFDEPAAINSVRALKQKMQAELDAAPLVQTVRVVKQAGGEDYDIDTAALAAGTR